MRFVRGKYYFDKARPVDEAAKIAAEKSGKPYHRGSDWMPLGDDYVIALQEYAKFAGPVRSCRVLSDTILRYKTEITPLPIKGRNRTKEAIDNELRTLDRFDKLFGHMRQDSLTQQMLYQYIDKRVDEREEFKGKHKAAPSAARHDVRFLKKVLTKGIKWGAGSTNAVLNLEFDSDPDDLREVTPEEFNAVYGIANERMQIAMDLAANIGQRRGDLLKIREQDITEEGISIQQGKTRASLIVEWSPGLRETVERARTMKPDIPKDFLLRSKTGKPYTSNGFKSIWQRLQRRALEKGLINSRFKFHHLRKKAATEKADLTTEEEAKDLLGHENLKTTTGKYLTHRKPKKVTPVR
jgi:integrase